MTKIGMVLRRFLAASPYHITRDNAFAPTVRPTYSMISELLGVLNAGVSDDTRNTDILLP